MGVSTFPTVIRTVRRQSVFTANGTFTVPLGVYMIDVLAVGGGGGGYPASIAAGGGGGAVLKRRLDVVPGQSISIVIGQGGLGSASGGAGTPTTVGPISAGGGNTSGTSAPGGPGGGRGGVPFSPSELGTDGYGNGGRLTYGPSGTSTFSGTTGVVAPNTGAGGDANGSSGQSGASGIAILEWDALV
jgi:hypothetical protein